MRLEIRAEEGLLPVSLECHSTESGFASLGHVHKAYYGSKRHLQTPSTFDLHMPYAFHAGFLFQLPSAWPVAEASKASSLLESWLGWVSWVLSC